MQIPMRFGIYGGVWVKILVIWVREMKVAEPGGLE